LNSTINQYECFRLQRD